MTITNEVLEKPAKIARFREELIENLQRRNLNPALITEDFYDTNHFPPPLRQIVKRGTRNIQGILIYKLIQIESSKIRARGTLSGSIVRSNGEPTNPRLSELTRFRELTYPATLAYILGIESFPRKRGTGKKLISRLQEETIDGIFLECLKNPRLPEIYSRIGLQPTGVYGHNRQKPVMIWTP